MGCRAIEMSCDWDVAELKCRADGISRQKKSHANDVNPFLPQNPRQIQCSPANPAQAGEEAVGLADLSGLPSSFCVLVGE